MKYLLITILLITGCSSSLKWSRTDKALLTASWVAAGADYYTTKSLLDDGGHENNPVIGEHPSNGKLATYMILSQIITVTIAHFFPASRKVLLGGKTLVNTGCAVHNSGE